MDAMNLYLLIVLAPLAGAVVAGFFGRAIGCKGAHSITIVGVGLSALLSLYVLYGFINHTRIPFNENVYTWLTLGGQDFAIGFLVDQLTALMLVMVTSISLLIHIYTIGYMQGDPGYQRFFSYISLFTFAMLMLVMSNNFIQLFFGWEAVGVVSYLLIGFWYHKPSAVYASLKAFLVNRVGDLGFLLGIGLVLAYFGGSLAYSDVFTYTQAHASELINSTVPFLPENWSLVTVTCLLLFVGAMGKSAQFPLHVWLPDSMEGPTPISALIHAATMVTAGIFMVARLSPLFELSDVALNTIMIIGAITALFMGLLGIVQNDIKRVIAYSTLSQLGYMTVALGASAYSAAVFHVFTHAFFKALLFLAAGSVIIGMHHVQDMRQMGGLRKYMPVTWITLLIGTLSLIGTPFFAGFFSKDTIIEAVQASNRAAAGYAYWALMLGVFITAFYSFRLYFMVFHGKENWHESMHEMPKESPWVVTLPLVLLAIPSVLAGFWIQDLVYGSFLTDSAIYIDATRHPAMAELAHEFQQNGIMGMVVHSFTAFTPFYLAAAGVLTAWVCYMKKPELPAKIAASCQPVYQLLSNKYYIDELYYKLFANGALKLGRWFWTFGDTVLIDNLLVNGTANFVRHMATLIRRVQTGFIYTYATMMVVGVVCLLSFWLLPLIWH